MIPDLPDDPIPALDALGDRLQAAASRTTGAKVAPLAGGRPPWRLAVVPAVALAAAVAVIVAVATLGRPAPADAEMLAAARRTADLPTGRFTIAIGLRAGSLDQRMTMTGAYDETAQQLQAQVDLSGILGRDTKLDVLVDGGTGYVRSPLLQVAQQAPSPWFRIDAARLGAAGTVPGRAGMAGSLPLAVDPSALLDLVGHAGGDVERVGADRLDGADTTHFRVEVRLSDAMAQLAPSDQERVRAVVGSLATTGAPVGVDVWVGTDGLVRRVAMGAAAAAAITVDYLEPGAPVQIHPPDPATTTDLGPAVDQALRQVLGG